MTSLSTQLRNLQLPDTLSVLNLQDKRASILFEAHEAADIDIDTIFSLGRAGLDELQEIDNDFAKFEKTLFNENVRTMERTQQPKEFNQRLDKKIKEFLVYLSPYFLIKPAQKALEWLIRRFRINVFNVDDLMTCVLPFHETNLFARVLSIVTFNKQTKKWDWLSQAKKAGIPLPKSVLIQHCLTDSSFLTFLCQMLPEAIEIRQNKSLEKLKTLCSFYTGVLVGITESPAYVTESRIGRMLPFLYQGLKSEMDDYKASSYMLLAQMCLIKTFKEQVISSVVEQICKTLTGETTKLGILALECICRNQKVKSNSTKSLKYICESKEILKLVSDLADKNALMSLQPVFIASLLHQALISTQSAEIASQHSVDYEQICVKFLQSINLQANAVKSILRKLLEQYVKLKDVSTDQSKLLQIGQKFIQIFEKRYPTEADSVLQGFLSQSKSENEAEWLQDLIMFGESATKFRVIPGTETSLLLCMNHSDPERRMLAVKELIRIISENEEIDDYSFAKSSLLQRLNDDDYSVVEEVFNAGKTLLQVIGEDEVIEAVVKKIPSAKFKHRLSMVKHLLTIFKEYKSSDALDKRSINSVFEIIPALLPRKRKIKEQIAVFKLLRESSFGSTNIFIEAIRTVVSTIDLDNFADSPTLHDMIQKAWTDIFKTAAKLLASNPNKSFLITVSLEFAASVDFDHSFKVFLVGTLFHLLDHIDKADVLAVVTDAEPFLRSVILTAGSLKGRSKFLENFTKPKDSQELFQQILHIILFQKRETGKDKDRFPAINLFCSLLRKIIQNLPLSNDGEANGDVNTHSVVFDLLASASGQELHNRPYVAIFRVLLQEFLKMHFPSPEALLNFLSSIFMKNSSLHFLSNESNNFGKIDVTVCALHIFEVCLETLNTDIDSITSFDSEVLPTLIVMFHHPLKIIREASIGCIHSLHGNSKVKIDNGLKYLLDYLVDNDTEIIEDRNQISVVLGRLFRPLSNADEDVEMMEPKRLEDLRLLAKYLSGFVLRSNINLKVGVATLTASVDFQEYLMYLMPFIENLIKCAQTTGLTALEFTLLTLLMEKFNPRNVNIFDKSPSSLLTFKTALKLGQISPGSNLSVQQECLKQVTSSFYENLSSSKTKNEIFDALLEAAVNSSGTTIITTIREKLIDLPIVSDDVAKQISNLREETGVTQAKKAKKTKRAAKSSINQDGHDIIDTPKWSKILLLLEVMQLKTNLVYNEKLILAIFDLLTFCLELNATNQPPIEYMKQLLLGSLRKSIDEILKSPERDVIAQEKFSLEKIIECFRTSENPQTHHQALLLLGRAASLFPDLVLHNIMPIFTFMGTNILRQDDSYSFDVIKKTIDAVVPTLVSAGTPEDSGSAKPGPNKDDIVKLVVRVFVDAVPYIPEHRRMLLFEHFSVVLGIEKYLYVIVAMLLEKLLVPMDQGKDSEMKISDGSSLSLDFPLILMKHFSLHEQVTTIANLFQFLAALADEKPEETRAKRVTRAIKSKHSNEDLVPLFDATKYSTNEIRQFKWQTLDFVSKVLADQDFIDKAASTDSTSGENLYLRLLEEMLEYLDKVGNKANEEEDAASLKYWKVQHQKGGEILNKVCKLLTFDLFIDVTKGLMENKNIFIRKKITELIGEKIRGTQQFNQDEMIKLLSITKTLVSMVSIDSIEIPINKHTALQTLKPLLILLSKDHAENIASTANVFIDLISSSGAHPNSSASALLCLGELVSALNARMIQFLPRLMPSLIELLRDEDKGKDMVILSSIIALNKIVVSLPKFLSPYIVQILEVLTSTRFDDNSVKVSSIISQIRAKIMSLRGEISEKILPRILLPALDSCFEKVINSEKHSLLALMDVTKRAVESMPRDSIKTNHVKILALFVKAFDIRCLYSKKPEQEVSIAEESIIAAFCALVMKMSENTFRPMYLKIFSWSTSNEEKNTRLITFYHLCCAISDKLKGLFLLFAGHIIKPCAELIAKCHAKNDNEDLELFKEDNETKTNALLTFIFDCLEKCFRYDTQGFLNKERFEYLMSSLVEQLDNDLGGISSYNERVLNHLNPCLASLAVAINDESCWKTLNYQILLKTRNQVSQVRFAALKLLEEIHKRIGESYLILLPETIPFLAELMEDESFEVEKQCQQVISHMEEILGESLQKYF